MKQLSVIIPIYNVKQYLRCCIESIFHQELDDDVFEVILVNDGTPDESMESIKDIIKSHKNIIVINQQHQGVSIARNNGIKRATGQYITFIDSDDLLIEKSIIPLLNILQLHQPDLIVAEYLKMDDNAIKYYQKTHIHKRVDYNYVTKSGQQILMEDIQPRHCYVWRNLYKRSFLQNNHIEFIPGIYFEDIPFIHECHIKAKNCIKTDLPIYIYRIGHDSITGSALNKQKAMDFCIAIYKTWELQEFHELSPRIKQKINDNAFDIFSLLSYSITEEIIDIRERIEIIKFLNQIAPQLEFTHGIKQRCISFAYKNSPETYIRFKALYQKFAKQFIY